MGDDLQRERERLRRIGARAFREVLDEDGPEQLEQALGLDGKDPVATGFDWGLAVGRDAGVALVFRSAVKWKFDRHIADAVSSLFADILDPDCLLDVMAALERVEKPSDLRDAALVRLSRAMNGPPPAPDPVLRLRRAFRATQRAPDLHGEPSADPAGGIIPPGPCREACEGWILGLLAGYRTGKDEGLGRIVASRASAARPAG